MNDSRKTRDFMFSVSRNKFPKKQAIKTVHQISNTDRAPFSYNLLNETFAAHKPLAKNIQKYTETCIK